jgi:hypothetical protein
MDSKIEKLLLSKLRQPIHISYIARYILKETEEKTQEIIESLISKDILEESKYAKNYYVIKQENKN